jgi:hypothetical protein
MDARPLRLALALGAFLFATPFALAAEYRTPNFVVTAPTPEFAKEVAMTAEQWRDRLAMEWLGRRLPKWGAPCPIQVKVGQLGAGGATTFNFGGGEVYGWRMSVQGTAERILDSVIPHEVSHTIFASHFRRPLPRWADEGAATLAEHDSEQRKQDLHLKQVWRTSRIPLSSLLSMTEYPSDMRDVLTLYAEGYSLADYLVQTGGRPKYLKFLDDAETQGWDAALQKHYGIKGTSALESRWGNWVLAGSPEITPPNTLVAGNDRRPAEKEVVRGQTPEADEEPAAPPTFAAARPSGRVRTAMNDSDFGGFLPPQTAGTPVAEVSASGKPARPEPLSAYRSRAGERRSRGASETGEARSNDGSRSLPRTSRVDPAASGDNDTPFESSFEEQAGARGRALGMNGFPEAR